MRTAVATMDLRVMVDDVVARWVKEGVQQVAAGTYDEAVAVPAILDPSWVGDRAAFSAYNVTLALRSTNPDKEIAHTQVRHLVPAVPALGDALVNGTYARLNAPMPNGQTSYVYVPVLPRAVVSLLPQDSGADLSAGDASMATTIDVEAAAAPVTAPSSSALVDNDPIRL